MESRKVTPTRVDDTFLTHHYRGTVFVLVMMFAIQDVDSVLATATKMPITDIIYQATNSRAAAVVLSIVPAVCFLNGTLGCVTSGSRLLWAMARDGGTPASK